MATQADKRCPEVRTGARVTARRYWTPWGSSLPSELAHWVASCDFHNFRREETPSRLRRSSVVPCHPTRGLSALSWVSRIRTSLKLVCNLCKCTQIGRRNRPDSSLGPPRVRGARRTVRMAVHRTTTRNSRQEGLSGYRVRRYKFLESPRKSLTIHQPRME